MDQGPYSTASQLDSRRGCVFGNPVMHGDYDPGVSNVRRSLEPTTHNCTVRCLQTLGLPEPEPDFLDAFPWNRSSDQPYSDVYNPDFDDVPHAHNARTELTEKELLVAQPESTNTFVQADLSHDFEQPAYESQGPVTYYAPSGPGPTEQDPPVIQPESSNTTFASSAYEYQAHYPPSVPTRQELLVTQPESSNTIGPAPALDVPSYGWLTPATFADQPRVNELNTQSFNAMLDAFVEQMKKHHDGSPSVLPLSSPAPGLLGNPKAVIPEDRNSSSSDWSIPPTEATHAAQSTSHVTPAMTPGINQAGPSRPFEGVALPRGAKRTGSFDSEASPRPAKIAKATLTHRGKPKPKAIAKPKVAKRPTPITLPTPSEGCLWQTFDSNDNMKPVVPEKRQRNSDANEAAAKPSKKAKTTPELVPMASSMTPIPPSGKRRRDSEGDEAADFAAQPSKRAKTKQTESESMVTNADAANLPSEVRSPEQPELSHTVPVSRSKRPRHDGDKDEGCDSDCDDEAAPLSKKSKQNAIPKTRGPQYKIKKDPTGRYYTATIMKGLKEGTPLGNPRTEMLLRYLASLDERQRLAWGVVPHFCPVPSCDFKGSSERDLEEHLDGPPHFRCPCDCKRSFNRRIDRKRHRIGPQLEEECVCTLEGCGKMFKRKDSRLRHEREAKHPVRVRTAIFSGRA
ncbi:hypothetical protein FA95DRAFT_826586 [Auriscalpium vulgare]|uniref:Uncharacterized protein n=1 Tax=Auriscalpium vulgare TaxID=40419 RepID=A0ACB8R9Q3_9AGAM|nr:hypothetical protein FA95DRAFT_826586 [Auriscalpium vulgare]